MATKVEARVVEVLIAAVEDTKKQREESMIADTVADADAAAVVADADALAVEVEEAASAGTDSIVVDNAVGGNVVEVEDRS